MCRRTKVVPGYTFGCGLVERTSPRPMACSQRSPITTISARRDMTLFRSRPNKSTRHGLYALLGYTWSRTFDSGFPDGSARIPGAIYWPLPGTQKADWGLSKLNLNDQFTASILYELPFGKASFRERLERRGECGLRQLELNVIEKATLGVPAVRSRQQ